MTIREFNSLEEIEKYYDKNSNTYIFKENDDYIDLVVFNFNLIIKANIDAESIRAGHISARNIDAYNIDVENINALDINAWDIIAWNINARNISYCGVCLAYYNFICKSIKGRHENSKHFVLDGKLEIKNDK